MALIVQKYGGSSVATPERIKAVAKMILDTEKAGNQVVAVVSARGDTTDELIALAKQITDKPPVREMDMLLSTGEQESVALLAMAIIGLGREAVSLTASQLGIVTDEAHTKARIKEIHPERIRDELRKGKIVIAAGFLGVDKDLNITTLGRGGSNLTAVALAHVLKADVCEMLTDVDGIYTADPRIVPDARRIDEISYDEMLELASLGATVLQSRSVEFAKKYGVKIKVRSSFKESKGTIVMEETSSMEDIVVRGAALTKQEAKLTILGVPDKPGIAARIFERIAEKNVNVDMIVQNIGHGGKAEISFTVLRSELPDALEVLNKLKTELGAEAVEADPTMAKVSIVGVGMRNHTGVGAKMFRALANEGINIEMISTSEIKLSCVVADADGERALRAVHKAFNLGNG